MGDTPTRDGQSYATLLDHVIVDGIDAVHRDYADDDMKREGSEAGFTACRGKTPPQLRALLEEAGADRQRAYNEEAEDYWYWRCREMEVEWVCNVVSAALMNSGLPMIVPPTMWGVMKAAEILGVRALRGDQDG